MSLSVYLFDPEALRGREPASIAAFGDVLAELQGRSPGPSRKFEAFARLLVADPGAALFRWLGDPVASTRSLASAVWNFDLPPWDPIRAMRHVVEAARAAGLAAYDDNLGIGFLPDGRVVPPERQQEWEDLVDALDEEADAKAQLNAKLRAAMELILGPLGFLQDEALAKRDQADISFSRSVEGGHQKVNVFVAGASPAFRSAIHLTGYVDAVSRIFERTLESPFPGHGRTFGFELRNLTSDYDMTPLWLEPQDRFQGTMNLLAEKAVPLMARASTPAGVDWLMNDEASPLRDHMRRRCTVGALATAFVAGNPRFESVARELVEAAKTKVDGTPQELQAILAHARGSGIGGSR